MTYLFHFCHEIDTGRDGDWHITGRVLAASLSDALDAMGRSFGSALWHATGGGDPARWRIRVTDSAGREISRGACPDCLARDPCCPTCGGLGMAIPAVDEELPL